MRIIRPEVIPIALPFREPYRTARGELGARAMVVLRLHTDEGDVGSGEAVPLSLRGGPSIAEVSSELARCASLLGGVEVPAAADRDPGLAAGWAAGLLDRCRDSGVGAQTLCAIDIALHDLAGGIAGVPVWRLLGASAPRPVSCNATIDASEPAVAGRVARAQAAEGFSTFKVKVGSGDDAERLIAVRAAVGERARIRIDANGAWSVGTALERIGELGSVGLELVEQPCADARDLAEVRARTAVPIVADESVASLADAERASALGACDAATLKLSKVGGPRAALEIGRAIPSYLSSALDGPLGIAAALHTAQALPASGFAADLAHGLATLEMFADTYADHEGLHGPAPLPPEGPGLGVEIDEEWLEELRIR